MNAQHLMRMPPDALAALVAPAVEAAGLARAAELLGARRAWFDLLLEQLRVRSRTVDDVARQAAVYLRDDLAYDDDAGGQALAQGPGAGARTPRGRARLAGRPRAWDAAAMEPALRGAAERMGVGAGKLFQPLRVALTGSAASPGMFDVLALLGRDRAIAASTRPWRDWPPGSSGRPVPGPGARIAPAPHPLCGVPGAPAFRVKVATT
jgi:glutamyl-tRNA synthetase